MDIEDLSQKMTSKDTKTKPTGLVVLTLLIKDLSTKLHYTCEVSTAVKKKLLFAFSLIQKVNFQANIFKHLMLINVTKSLIAVGNFSLNMFLCIVGGNGLMI